MRRRLALSYLLRIIVVVTALGLLPADMTDAGTMRFGGHQGEDNFWTVTPTYCRDGIILAAVQTQLGDGLPYSLQLWQSSPAVQAPLPAPVAQGDSSILVDHTATFLFTTPVTPGAPVAITIQRWDHGIASTGDPTDGSFGDDELGDSSTAGVCTVAPRTALLHVKGAPGSRNVLTGAGFAPSEVITATWNAPSGPLLGHTVTDAQGAFTGTTALTFTTPAGPLGPYTVVATGQSSGDVVSSPFTMRPAVGIVPSSGAPGSAATAFGAGFASDEFVWVRWLCAPPACAGPTTLGVARTNFFGDFGLAVTIPATATPGLYAVAGIGLSSGGTAFTVYKVT